MPMVTETHRVGSVRCRSATSASDVSFGSDSDVGECPPIGPFMRDKQTLVEAVCRSLRCHFQTPALQQQHCYSITSSARASNVAGMSKPSALADLRLITRSNL